MKKQKIMLLSGLFAIIAIVSLSWSNLKTFGDFDGDGIEDVLDNCPNNENLDQSDFDSDRQGDVCDVDDDNDGVYDTIDSFDKDPHDWADFDFDGIGSSNDMDDDNDGVADDKDTTPIPPSEKITKQYMNEIQSCIEVDNNNLRLICYSQFFNNIITNDTSNSDALELAVSLSKIGTIDDCHFISHEIGHTIYDTNQNVTQSLIGMDGTICRGGYFHGVLASYFHKIKESDNQFPDSYKTICADLAGTSNYQDCIHGIGHGLVHYFEEDIESPLKLCHDMSFYQNLLCRKGLMMQYTEDYIIKSGTTEDTLSEICEKPMSKIDHVECSMSVGSTLAFFANHDLDEGSKLCNLIHDTDTKNYCIDGLRLEIEDSKRYETNPLTQDNREKFQPYFIPKYSKYIDVVSPATISEFEFVPETGLISFSIDTPRYVVLYIPEEFLSSNMIISVNGQIPDQIKTQHDILGEKVAMIRFVPNHAGKVLFSPIS